MDSLLDLLCKYREENPSDCCDRLGHVITIIEKLKGDALVAIEKYKAGLPVTDEEEDDKAKMPLIVLWFETPLFYWSEVTYAVFLVSFMTSFFNPNCPVEDIGNDDVTTVTPPSDTERKQILSQFGRILRYIHTECTFIAPYFDTLWKHGDYTALEWRSASPYKIQARLAKVWSTLLDQCNDKGNDIEHKAPLYECVMNMNVELLQKGMEIPPVLAHMLMHYYNARLNEITVNMMEKLKEEEGEKVQ